MNLFYTRCAGELNISSACLDDLIQHLVIRVTLVLDYTNHSLNYIPLEYLPPHLHVELQPLSSPHAAYTYQAGYYRTSTGPHHQVEHLVNLGPCPVSQLPASGR